MTTPTTTRPPGPEATADRSALRATARLTAAPDARGRTVLPELVGAGPLALRRTSHPDDPAAAQVTIVGAMAAPLRGDHLRILVHVEPGASLRVTSAAATVSLPSRGGGSGEPARYEVDLHLAEDAVLEWLPEPVIAAAASALHLHTRVHLAPRARLLLREEQILGRAADAQPGRLTARLTVRRNHRTVLDQQTDLGPGAPAWDGPAVLGPHRALGQLLSTEPLEPVDTPDGVEAADLAIPADHPLTLRTALARDGLLLRRALRVTP